MTDPIADLLTRIRNGVQARKEYVECPHSTLKERIARLMVDEGFLRDVHLVEEGPKKMLRVFLRYHDGSEPVIIGLERVSKPSRRVYVGAKSMPLVRRGMGINIISTAEGVLVDREAVRRNVGGEILCRVW